MNNFTPWPGAAPYPESVRDSRGQGTPDFPKSQGGREYGGWRPGRVPDTTVLAVGNDDGTPVAAGVEQWMWEVLTELRALRIGMERLLQIQDDNTDYDLIDLAFAEAHDDS